MMPRALADASLPHVTAAILQWWLWSSLLVVAALAVARACLSGRPAARDFIFRLAIAAAPLLLLASAALTLASLQEDASEAPARRAGGAGLQTVAIESAGSSGSAPGERHSATRAAPEVLRAALPLDRQAQPAFVAKAAPNAAADAGTLGRLAIGGAVELHFVALGIYLLGVAVCLSFLAGDLLRLARLRRRSAPCSAPDILEAIASACSRAGVRARVAALTSPRFPALALAGWLRPAVLVPQAFAAGMARRELELLMRHEIAHVRRRDLAWRLALRFFIIACWPLPFPRWLARPMRQTSEILCDRLALSRPEEAEEYARSLASALERSAGAESPGWSVAAVSKSSLRRRIEMLLGPRLPAASLSRLNKVAISLAGTSLSFLATLIEVRAQAPEVNVDPGVVAAQPPELATDSGVVHDSDPPLPEELRLAQERLADLVLAEAAKAYAAADFTTARSYLRRARDLGLARDRLHPLAGGAGVLILDKDFVGSAFVHWCIEKTAGALETEKPGHWADPQDQFLVQDESYLEEARKALFSGAGPGGIVVEATYFRLPPHQAREIAVGFGETEDGADWRRELSPEQGEELARLRDRGDGEVKVESSPKMFLLDRQFTKLIVVKQSAYIEKVEPVTLGAKSTAEPSIGVLNEGVEVEIFPMIEDDGGIRLLISSRQTRLRDSKLLTVTIEPFADDVPLQVPILERENRKEDIAVKTPHGVLIGSTPAEKDSSKSSPLTWIWIKAAQPK